MKILGLLLLSTAALGPAPGCLPTTFEGSAYFPGGAHGCYTSCAKINMEMSAYVMTGEFASSCVCRVKRKAGTSEATAGTDSDAQAADAAAHAAVEVRRREAATVAAQR